jgi:serine/threonine protein kinase
MGIKIKIIKALEEVNAMAVGSVEGAPGAFGDKETVDAFNRKQAVDQRLKGGKLVEMYSSSVSAGVTNNSERDDQAIFDGFEKRGIEQGLQNIKESENTAPMKVPPEEAATVIDPMGSAIKSLGIKTIKAAQDAGFKFISHLGGGQFGQVFRVQNKNTGEEFALKIVGGTPLSVDREVRNYELVQQARKKSPTIAKHFPETFASWKEKGYGYIVMEILEDVKYKDEAMVVDRTNILSRDHSTVLRGRDVEVGQPQYRHYRDQSKKAAYWFINEFVDSLRGKAQEIQDEALLGLVGTVPDDIDYSDLLMNVSPAAMLGLKAKFEIKGFGGGNNKNESLDFFLSNENDYPQSSRLLKMVVQEAPGAPYVAAGIAVVGKTAEMIRRRAMESIGYNNVPTRRLDKAAFLAMLPLIRGYRETSTMRLQYDKSGPEVATGKLTEKWDQVAKELHDLTGLAPRDVHYGNIMQRPSGDLVIVDLGLFKNEKDSARMFETKKYKIKLLRKSR